MSQPLSERHIKQDHKSLKVAKVKSFASYSINSYELQTQKMQQEKKNKKNLKIEKKSIERLTRDEERLVKHSFVY